VLIVNARVLFYSKSSYFEPYLLYSNDVVDRSLQARESMIQLIKHHLHKAQHHMKQLADKHRSERQSAIGVSFTVTKWGGITTREHAEVILCAGAIGSPQLLLLSGIGPRPYLSSWGIQVANHLPYVEQLLYDNPRNGITFVPSIPLEHSLIQVVGITDSGAYIDNSLKCHSLRFPPLRSSFTLKRGKSKGEKKRGA